MMPSQWHASLINDLAPQFAPQRHWTPAGRPFTSEGKRAGQRGHGRDLSAQLELGPHLSANDTSALTWDFAYELNSRPSPCTGRGPRIGRRKTRLTCGAPLRNRTVDLLLTMDCQVAARLISPALGTAVFLGKVPRMDPAEVCWQPVLGSPLPLSLPGTDLAGSGERPAAGQLASALRQSVLNGPIRTLTRVTAALSVSPRVLQGNVASAVNAAAFMIARACPGRATRAATIRSALLNAPELTGTWTSTAAGFRRRSCCLIYRAACGAPMAVCRDCILNTTSPSAPPR